MKKILFLLGQLACQSILNAQHWEPTYGPCSNTPWDIKKIGTTLFLASDWGNYRSSDNGAHWTSIDLPAPEYGGSITSFWPIDEDIYFKNYVSHDGGTTWQHTSLADPDIIKYIKDGSTLYALSEYLRPAFSDDNGATWKNLPQLPPGYRTGMAVLSSKVYVSISDLGVYYLSYGDTSWHLYNEALSSPVNLGGLETTGTDLYLIDNNKVYRSLHGNGRWAQVGTWQLGNAYITHIYIFKSVIFLGTTEGIFYADMGNYRWQKIPGNPQGYIYALAYDGNDLFAGFNYEGLYRTDLTGQSWTLLNQGIYAGHRADQIVCTQGKIWTMYSYYHKINYSANRGHTWNAVKFGYTVWWPVDIMTSIFANGDDVYYGEENGYIYYSNDGCMSTSVSDSSMKNDEYRVARKFVALGPGVYVLYGNSIYKSSSRGARWHDINFSGNGSILDITSCGADLFVATIVHPSTINLFKSVDGGDSWELTRSFAGYDCSLTSYEKDLYACASDTILYSPDHGITWQPISVRSLHAGQIYSSTAAPGGLYVVPVSYGNYGSAMPHGIYRYANGTWQAVNAGLPDFAVLSLATDGENLYAGIDYAGVYKLALNPTPVAGIAGLFTDFMLYPNPAPGVFSVKTESAAGELKIYDETGRCVYSTILKEKCARIDPGIRQKGIYFVELRNQEAIKSKKIVIE